MTSYLITAVLTWGVVGTEPAAGAPDAVVVRATGIGRARPGLRGPQARLMARRAAEIVAVRNLRAKLGGLRCDGATGGERFRVEGTVRGHRFGPTRFRNDGGAEVDVEVTLPRATVKIENESEQAEAASWYDRFRRALSQRSATTTQGASDADTHATPPSTQPASAD